MMFVAGLNGVSPGFSIRLKYGKKFGLPTSGFPPVLLARIEL